jgi:uncharacterized membrane protein YfcA
MTFDITVIEYVLIALAGVAGGMVNALAGGGTLITFPMLTAAGLGAVVANVTNTTALLPGYLGATFAQSKDLKGQKPRLLFLLPAGFIGGAIGGLLLLNTGEKLFTFLVPFLILLASVLLALADPVRGYLQRRSAARLQANPEQSSSPVIGGKTEFWCALPVALAAIYGGYFGAGLSVIVLATLGLILNDNLTRLNALKQFIAFSANVAAAIFFVFSGKVFWPAALVLAVGALIGGSLGGRLASRIKPSTLRKVVVALGFILSVVYFLRLRIS